MVDGWWLVVGGRQMDRGGREMREAMYVKGAELRYKCWSM